MTMWSPRLSQAAAPKYVAIAEALAEDIARGRLKAGDRLPTHRWLATRMRVTVGTITRAYAEAQRRGLVSGEVGRGSFVRPPAVRAATSGTLGDPIDLSANYLNGGSQPRILAGALEALARSSELPGLIGYQPAAGLARHRSAGARWLARRGCDASADRVLVCAGAQHAMTIAFATLLRPGDVILTESLTYAGMTSLAALLHLEVRGVAMDAEGVRPEALEDACCDGRARALYCMPTVQNPTTAVMSHTRRRAIAELARRFDLWIVEDDTYGFAAPERPLVALAPERTCYIMSLSKSLAPGMRIGYLMPPAEWVDRLTAAICTTVWMASPLTAEIATRWIIDGSADALVKWKLQEAAARTALARRVLSRSDMQTHAAGQHLWLKLPGQWTSLEFTAAARRSGVVVTAAETFAVIGTVAPSAVRVCLGTPSTRAELGRGLAILAELLEGAPAAPAQVV